MRYKILAFLLSATLLFASLAIGVGAAFILTNDKDVTLEMKKYELPEESINFINKMFDKTLYDATIYDAYKVSLTDANGVPVEFTAEMELSINIGEEFDNTEIFVFAVNENTGKASEIFPASRNGANLTIKGENFKPFSDDIIVIMTSTKNVVMPTAVMITVAICTIIIIIVITICIIVKTRKKSSNFIEPLETKNKRR